MDTIAQLSRRLLHRAPCSEPPVPPSAWTNTSLASDLARLGDPERSLVRQDVAAMVLKLFHAYVNPGSEETCVPLSEITLLMDRFANRRHGFAALEGRRELRRLLLDHGFALSMIADLPKTVHIVHSIAARSLAAQGKHRFYGLDIGAGTGVLMVAMHLCAGRNGFESRTITGIERDRRIQERADGLMRRLGTGRVLLADAKDTEAYASLAGKPIHFVCNETLPSLGHRLWKEDFPVIGRTLVAALGREVENAAFFPEALLAAGPGGEPARLCAANGFAPKTSRPIRLLRAAAITINDRTIPLDHIGKEERDLVTDSWRDRLSHRW